MTLRELNKVERESIGYEESFPLYFENYKYFLICK